MSAQRTVTGCEAAHTCEPGSAAVRCGRPWRHDYWLAHRCPRCYARWAATTEKADEADHRAEKGSPDA